MLEIATVLLVDDDLMAPDTEPTDEELALVMRGLLARRAKLGVRNRVLRSRIVAPA